MIIIKTPQPDTEERLVLVPPDAVSRTEGGDELLTIRTANARDATPADLARGGYVRDGDTRAGLREALRARERAELDALAELDEQRARAEKAEGLLIQRETELRLAREDGDERARDLRQAYERAMAAAEKAERERDEAKAGHNAVQPRVYALEADLAETVHERDTLRAELARLTAPGEDLREVSAELEAMRTTHDERDRVYVGAIASDDELVTVYRRAAEPLGDEHGVSLRDLVRRCQARGVLAVAARVRQERCLVAQAVARGWYIYLCPQKNDPSKWDIETGRVIAGRSDGGAILHGVPASDVPATLARLLGEVEK